MKHPGCSLEDMVVYEKPIAGKKLDTLITHVKTNDLANGVNAMKKVRKCVEVIRELEIIQKTSRINFLILSRGLIKTLAIKSKKPILS